MLVHGAFADASGYQRLIPILQRDGYEALAVQIPLASLDGDVETTKRFLDGINGSIVLVGHSYGGAVITGAAAGNPKVKALVYVAALAPDEGETVADVFTRGAPHPDAPKLAPDAHGLMYLPEAAFPAAFAQNASKEELAVLAAVQRPISPACITVRVGRPLWKDRPSWFLVAEQDRMIVAENHRFMAARMKAHVRSHPVDHTPLVTAPSTVVDIIREAIAEVAKG